MTDDEKMEFDGLRGERLQVMLTLDELRALDDFRFKRRMPSRAAAIRELLRRGLAADGFVVAPHGSKSKQFGVMGDVSGSNGHGPHGKNGA
jgi:hypothetical protein